MSFKTVLKSIFPIPAKGFMREVRSIRSNDDKNAEKIVEALKRENGQLKDLLNKQNSLISEMHLMLQQIQENGQSMDLLNQQYSLMSEMHLLLQQMQESSNRQFDAVSDVIGDMHDKENALYDEYLHKRTPSWMRGEQAKIISAQINPDSRNLVYRREFERIFYKNTFNRDVFESEDYSSRVLDLTRGLDEESIYIVSRNLYQLRSVMYFENEKMSLRLYTQDEQRSINNELDKFQRSIISLSDSIHYWNGYLLPIPHFEYCVFGDKHGIYKLDNIKAVENRHIIDAGAFIGDSALIFSPLTQKSVHCFEANKSNCELIKKTVELNHISNVVINNAALSDENGGKCTLSISDITPSCSNMYSNDGFDYSSEETVDTITLDAYVEENGLDVGLIKVDIEGAEQAFLKGAMNTIIRQKPILIISIYHNASDFFDIKPMLEKLDLGYRFKVHRPKIQAVMLETVLIAEVPDNGNREGAM